MLNKNEIINILNDWNCWQKPFYAGVPRPLYLNRLKKILLSRQVTVITGARRSGKSFLMRQLAAEKSQTLGARNLLFVNFEDPRFDNLDTNLLENIFEIYLEFLKPDQTPLLLLDEIQEVKNWEKWVNTLYELKKASVIVSGSNAKLLSSELGTLLTGRHLDLEVFPLSFQEFTRFKGLAIKDQLDFAANKISLRGCFAEYQEFGSFPEIVFLENKKEILLHYFEDILNKDIIRRHHLRRPQILQALAKFYLTNFSSPITWNSLAKSLNLAVDTVEKFSFYLEQSYLFFFLKRFSFKLKEQEKSPRKVYALDTGLANALGFRFSQNQGKLCENLVFLTLKRKQSFNPWLELYYWKDESGREVDFVLKEKSKVTKLIQVCVDLKDEKVKKRELKNLIKAAREFGLNEALVITLEETSSETINDFKIHFRPLLRWLWEEETTV